MTAKSFTIEQINQSEPAGFVAALGDIFEASPWVAEQAFQARPFADGAALLAAMRDVVEHAALDRQLALIRAHPELAVHRAARAGLGRDSAREQAGAGLDRLSEPEFALFRRLNRAYRERFAIPFVIAVRGLDKDAILAALRTRLAGDRAAELHQALRNIYRIAEFRLTERLSPPMAARI